MALNHSPRIVTDGLVLCLDAGNTKSYPGSGTAVTDLTRNGNNGTLVNGVVYSSSNNGIFTFDGTNDYMTISGSTAVSAATFLIWMRRNGAQGNYDGIFYGRSSGSNVNGLSFFGTSNKLSYTWAAAASSYTFDSGLLIPDLQWCMCAATITSSAAVLYVCSSSGISSATNTTAHSSTTIAALEIGRDNLSSRYSAIDASFAALYNRALSSTEIQQNFNALRGRFGI